MTPPIEQVVALLGGTFDPIHNGHLRMALEAKQMLKADQLRLIPCASPPHRPCQLSAQERLLLAQMAVADCNELEVDDRELNRSGPSYTVDTLIELREQLGANTSIVLLLGMDAYAELTHWHRWRELRELAHIAVMHRPANTADCLSEPLEQWLNSGHSVRQVQTTAAGCVLPLIQRQLAISATDIRTLLARGENPQFLLPQPVLNHINQQGWYRSKEV